jgi:thioredoxin-like negative regulator of GroEL
VKSFIYICLLAGAIVLPTSERARSVFGQIGMAALEGVEEVLWGEGYAEVRMVDESNFEKTINSPGRLIIVDIHHEEISVARSDKSDLNESMNRLPSEVLVAKVLAGKNIALLDQLQIHNIPTLRVYRDGEMLEEFKGKVDQERFLKNVRYHLNTPDSTASHAGYIGPLKKDWLPEGIEESTTEDPLTPLTPITPLNFDSK